MQVTLPLSLLSVGRVTSGPRARLKLIPLALEQAAAAACNLRASEAGRGPGGDAHEKYPNGLGVREGRFEILMHSGNLTYPHPPHVSTL